MKALKEKFLEIILPRKPVPPSLSDMFRPNFFLPPPFQFNIDGILGLFSRIYVALRGYRVGELVITRVVNELLKLVGAMAFNDLVKRTSLPRSLADEFYQNTRRIGEWCKSHDMPESILQLEHLMVHMFFCHL